MTRGAASPPWSTLSGKQDMADADHPAKRHWDVIVIGTGIGGATLGHALARAGRRVLFCEQGMSHLDSAAVLRGQYAELFFPEPSVPQQRYSDILQRAGRWHESVCDDSFRPERRFIPFLGAGAGGSSALYGMAMERFFPADFAPRAHYPQADESSLPERWPVSYEEMRPYYDAAERLYRVRGTADPGREAESFSYLDEPPAPSPAAAELYGFFSRKGLRPYRLPLACERVNDCLACQGYLCPKACKNDSARICLLPALGEHGAALLDQCRVLHLEANQHEVTRVVCSWRGEQVVLQADQVVLAAGALQTPMVLLRSRSKLWPQGLANDSGLVGRNLMRHCVDLYVVFTRARQQQAQYKEIAFNDLYNAAGVKLGSVQSFGALPPASVLVEELIADLGRGGARAALASASVKSGLRWLFGRIAARGVVLASILEDLPYRDNRVVPDEDGSGMVLHYRLRTHDRERIKLFRTKMREILRPYRYLPLKQAENNKMLAHVCGTCRFGLDAGSSVLDKCNKAHGLANLYVVDSSFFPSSAGINPSLTIAANALRVAEHILQK